MSAANCHRSRRYWLDPCRAVPRRKVAPSRAEEGSMRLTTGVGFALETADLANQAYRRVSYHLSAGAGVRGKFQVLCLVYDWRGRGLNHCIAPHHRSGVGTPSLVARNVADAKVWYTVVGIEDECRVQHPRKWYRRLTPCCMHRVLGMIVLDRRDLLSHSSSFRELSNPSRDEDSTPPLRRRSGELGVFSPAPFASRCTYDHDTDTVRSLRRHCTTSQPSLLERLIVKGPRVCPGFLLASTTNPALLSHGYTVRFMKEHAGTALMGSGPLCIHIKVPGRSTTGTGSTAKTSLDAGAEALPSLWTDTLRCWLARLMRKEVENRRMTSDNVVKGWDEKDPTRQGSDGAHLMVWLLTRTGSSPSKGRLGKSLEQPLLTQLSRVFATSLVRAVARVTGPVPNCRPSISECKSSIRYLAEIAAEPFFMMQTPPHPFEWRGQYKSLELSPSLLQ
ncbi:hypothetical protein IQ06DRAFT_334437 [Phaeosphaeriaceae sp. SRC1lsM3a]|nr:hypothetical protein IQ06DRAFT_334437 [Stagonospora sp. SRC1lsM3a]